ncbi:MAG TPA: hypothetical protein VHY35_01685 [Stellaceae bacterium]|jgi:hypothetical protein|nr:hypothetical protein [Stellaceae bacterium]
MMITTPARQRRHQPINLTGARRRVLRAAVPPLVNASEALHLIMADGDVFLVGRQRYLVAPITQDMLDTLIQASAIGEDDEADADDEPNGDFESSLGTVGDRESDGLDFGEEDRCDDEPSCQPAELFRGAGSPIVIARRAAA